MLVTKGAAAAMQQEAGSRRSGRSSGTETGRVQAQRTWTPLQDTVGDYKYKLEEKTDFSGKKVKLINDNYDPGVPTEKEDWRSIEEGRTEMLKQVKTSLRYWYSESYGSERRKKPA